MNSYRDIDAFAASAVGRSHRRAGRGGQDAHALVRSRGAVVAVVCDGCSSGARSEVGAGVGARFVAARCARLLSGGSPLEQIPSLVHAQLVLELGRLARALSASEDEVSAVVDAHLLFTTLAVVATPARAVVFGVGDGVVSADGCAHVIDDGEAPDYAAYALFDMRAPKLVVHHCGGWSSSIAIGTDGAAELIAQSSTRLADGSELGGISLLERDARFVKNASLAQKRFNAWCDASSGPVDDCTIAVVRRGVS